MKCEIKYKGKDYSFEEYIELLNSGEIDALIRDGVLDRNELKGEIEAAQESVQAESIESAGAETTEAGGVLQAPEEEVTITTEAAPEVKPTKGTGAKTEAKVTTRETRKTRLAKIFETSEGEEAVPLIEQALSESGIKVEVKDDADYNEDDRIKSGQGRGSEGMFIADDGTIVLNRDKIKGEWGKTIVFHEGIHPVINIIRNTDPKRYRAIVEGLKAEATRNKGVAQAVADVAASEEYQERGAATIEDETLVETMARVANGKVDIDTFEPSFREKFIEFMNDIAKMFGLKRIAVNSPRMEVKRLADQINKMLNEGGKLSDIVGKKNVGKFQNTVGTPTGIVQPSNLNRAPKVKVNTKGHKLSFVKPSDIKDISALIKEIADKNQKVWFWVADQLGRGLYFDSAIDGYHFLDAGPSFALDPENRSKNVIWATGKNQKEIEKLMGQADYIFIISGSPQQSKLFNKKISEIVFNRIEKAIINEAAGEKIDPFKKFKDGILSVSKVSSLNKILDSVNSFDELLKSPKRKQFLIDMLNQQSKQTPLKKLFEKYNAFVDLNEFRDGFYADNNFELNDIMLVLKPTGFGGTSKHSTYENDVLGEVVGVPDRKINAYDIMTDEFKAKYGEMPRTQQQQTVAPYGIGVRSVQASKGIKRGSNLIKDTYYESGLTEDKNDYIFFHVSSAPEASIRKGIDSTKYTSLRTSREEKGLQYGVASYYTRPEDGERMVGGEKYAVRVPKTKVYPIDSDPLGYGEKAEAKIPQGTPFRGEAVKREIADMAKKNGYEMIVGEWSYSRTGKPAGELPEFRADALVPLKPTKEKPESFTSNAEKGMERIPFPSQQSEQAKQELESIASEVRDIMSSKKKFSSKEYELADSIFMTGQVTENKYEENESRRDVTQKDYDAMVSVLPKSMQTRVAEVREMLFGRPAQKSNINRGEYDPLPGAPTPSGATGPIPELVDIAKAYAKKIGIPYSRQAEYVNVDEEFAKRVAVAYEEMEHAPNDPKVKEAYSNLIKQTTDQYNALVEAGYEFSFFDDKTDPYDGNPVEAMRDLRANKKMAVYQTKAGFGTEGITASDIKDNPMLAPTGLKWPDQNGEMQDVTANDLFRAVHDAFGHGLEGAGFRARGEENAWQAHVRLFTGSAIAAITSETRGQNSWLNYGPYGDRNRKAKVQDTVFAEQKTGLMPSWTWEEGIAPNEKPLVDRNKYLRHSVAGPLSNLMSADNERYGGYKDIKSITDRIISIIDGEGDVDMDEITSLAESLKKTTGEKPAGKWEDIYRRSANEILTSIENLEANVAKQERSMLNERSKGQPSMFNRTPDQVQDLMEGAMDAAEEAIKNGSDPQSAVDENISSQEWYSELTKKQKEQFDEIVKDEFGVAPQPVQKPVKDSEPPVTDKEEPKPESKKRKRRFIKQVNESDKIRPEVKNAFSEDAIYYSQIPNDLTLDEANEIIDAAGLDEAKSMVLTNSKNISPRVRITLAQVLIKKFNEEGDIESAVDVAEDIAEVGTELGQAIQAFSMFQFLTPEGQLLKAQREAARQRAAQLAKPVHKNRVNKIVKGIKKATGEAVDETIKRMSGKIGQVSTVKVNTKRDSSYGQKNVIVKKSDYERAVKNLKGKMFSSFVPPPELITIAAYHIEAGARDFASFSKRMIEDFGDKVKDYLKPTYEAANAFLGNKQRTKEISDLRKRFESLVNPPQRKTPEERKSRTERAYEVAKALDDIFGGTEYTEIAEQFDKETLEKQWAEAKKNFEERKAKADKRNDEKERERIEQQEKDAKLEAANKEYKQGEKIYDKASSEFAVTEGLRELSVDIQKLIRSHYTEVNKTKETLKDKLIKQIGLDPKEATDLAGAIERQFDALIREKRSRAIANAFPKRKQREAKSVDEKLMEASNLGLIDEAVVNEFYAEAMGFPKVTAQNAKDIKNLADRVQEAKTERERARAVEDLLSYQAKMKGFSLSEASLGVYLSALLSGPKTQAINIIANIYNTISLYSDAVLQRPKNARYLAKGLFVGLKRGLFEGADVMRTGYAPIRGKVDIPTILERERFTGGAFNPANYAKYVRRFMLAADTVFFEGLRQMRAFQLANKMALDEGLSGKEAEKRALEILGRNDESLQYAIDTANAEMNEQIDNVRTSNMTDAEKKAAIKQIKIDLRFRIHELIEKNRPSEIKEKSHKYGVEGTFNQRPTGVLGVLSDAMNDVSRKLPAAKLVVPFVNVISNVANTLIDNSPGGFARAYKNTKGVFGKGEVMDEQERVDAYTKALKGTTIMAIAYLLTQLTDDDDEPILEVTTNGYGDYAKNQDLINSGWRPYSFRVKNPFTGEYTGWVSYKESPIMLGLSTIGNWSDFEKYRKADKDDTFFTKMAVSSTGAVRSMMDATFLSSGEKFLGNILDPRNESVFDDMGAWAGGAVSSFVSPGLVSQSSAMIQDFMDTPDKEIRETIFGRMIKNIPVARDRYANKVNGLGEDISPQSEIVISLAEKSDSDDLWELLINKKATTSPPARGKEVFITNEGVERPMTDDEFYKYSKIRGQFLKKQLRDNYNELKGLDEESFRKWLSDAKGDASLVAKTYLPMEFPKGTVDYMEFIEKSIPPQYIKTFMVIPDKKNNNVFSVQADLRERIFNLKQK